MGLLFFKKLFCGQACEKHLVILVYYHDCRVNLFTAFGNFPKGMPLEMLSIENIMLPLVSYRLLVGIIMLFGKCFEKYCQIVID